MEKYDHVMTKLPELFAEVVEKDGYITCSYLTPGNILSFIDEESCKKRIKSLGVSGSIETIERSVGITKFKFKK